MAIFKNILTALGEAYSVVGVKSGRIELEFDTIDECTTGGSATVTKYPTENGILATDYKYKNPDTVTMVGIVSEGGLTGFSSIYRIMGKWDRKSAIEAIRKNLDTLVGNMTLLNIQTRNAGRRTNMTLTAYEINETYDTFGTMQVTMQFQQVPQFNKNGTVARNASDLNTTDTGIMNTQSLLAIGAGALAAGGIVSGNIAAFD
jgi:hypothetical protein